MLRVMFLMIFLIIYSCDNAGTQNEAEPKNLEVNFNEPPGGGGSGGSTGGLHIVYVDGPRSTTIAANPLYTIKYKNADNRCYYHWRVYRYGTKITDIVRTHSQGPSLQLSSLLSGYGTGSYKVQVFVADWDEVDDYVFYISVQ